MTMSYGLREIRHCDRCHADLNILGESFSIACFAGKHKHSKRNQPTELCATEGWLCRTCSTHVFGVPA